MGSLFKAVLPMAAMAGLSYLTGGAGAGLLGGAGAAGAGAGAGAAGLGAAGMGMGASELGMGALAGMGEMGGLGGAIGLPAGGAAIGNTAGGGLFSGLLGDMKPTDMFKAAMSGLEESPQGQASGVSVSPPRLGGGGGGAMDFTQFAPQVTRPDYPYSRQSFNARR